MALPLGLPGKRPSREGRSVPDLLWDQPARSRHARHGFEIWLRVFTQQERHMASLTGQQWPGSAYPRAIEGAAIRVLARAIVVVAVIARPRRRFHPQERVSDFE